MDRILTFTEAELGRIHTLAVARGVNARANGTPDNRFSGDSGFDVDYAGLLGEAAVAFYLDIPFSPEVRKSDKQAGDLTLPDGRTVDVKFRKFYRGDLLFTSVEDFVADVAVLVFPSKRPVDRHNPKFDTYRWDNPVVIGGWVSRQVFGIFATRQYYGRECMALPYAYLTPIDQIWDAEKLDSPVLGKRMPGGR